MTPSSQRSISWYVRVPAEMVDAEVRSAAHDGYRLACAELRLEPPPLLVWVKRCADPGARRRPSVHHWSGRSMAGWCSGMTEVFVLADLEPERVVDVVGHELWHLLGFRAGREQRHPSQLLDPDGAAPFEEVAVLYGEQIAARWSAGERASQIAVSEWRPRS